MGFSFIRPDPILLDRVVKIPEKQTNKFAFCYELYNTLEDNILFREHHILETICFHACDLFRFTGNSSMLNEDENMLINQMVKCRMHLYTIHII